MFSDQCALNADSSLKDVNEIQWSNDKDCDHPLPSSPAVAQPLGWGLRNKTTNWFSDAVAHEQLDSDEEIGPFTESPKHKCATWTSKVSVRVAAPTLSSSNSFETLPVKESSGEDDTSFNMDSGDESGNGNSTESISNTEVWCHLFYTEHRWLHISLRLPKQLLHE